MKRRIWQDKSNAAYRIADNIAESWCAMTYEQRAEYEFDILMWFDKGHEFIGLDTVVEAMVELLLNGIGAFEHVRATDHYDTERLMA